MLPGGHSRLVFVLGADCLGFDHLISQAESAVEFGRVISRRGRRRESPKDVAMRHFRGIFFLKLFGDGLLFEV